MRPHVDPETAWQPRAIAKAIRLRDIGQARVLLRQHRRSLLERETVEEP